MAHTPSTNNDLLLLIAKQRKMYDRIGVVGCSIIKRRVRFNIAGFRHLHVDGQGKYRTKRVAMARLELLQYAAGVIERSKIINTDHYTAAQTPSKKPVTYHNLYAKVGPRQLKVMVTIRVIGGGEPHFYGIRRD